MGEIVSPDRESAFQQLHANGIKPMQFWEMESQARPSLGGVKRWVAIGFLSAVVVGLLTYILWTKTSARKSQQPVDVNVGVEVGSALRRIAKAKPRQPVDGYELLSLDSMFAHPSEVVLARFVQPGRCPGAKLDRIEITRSLEEDLYAALDDAIWIEEGDASNVIDVKRIVAGLKNEAEMYLDNGHTFQQIVDFFIERMRMERGYFRMPK